MRITFRRAMAFGRKPKPYRRHTLVAFFQNPAAVNWATWAGLVVSVVGFGVSIQQIMKVKSATKAAATATEAAFEQIRERINLTEVATALSYIDAIIQAVDLLDYAGALRNVGLLRAKLISMRQISPAIRETEGVERHLAELSLLADELGRARQGDADLNIIQFRRALEPIGDTLHHYAGQLRYMGVGQ